MRSSYFTFLVDHKAHGKGIHSAVKLRDRIVAHQNPVIDLAFGYIRFHGRPAVIIHRNSEHGKTLRLILLFKIDKPGNFKTARTAPGSPKVEENHFAAVIG